MEIKQIVFTEKNKAELLKCEINEPGENEVLIKTAYTTISPGTEKANFIGDINIDASAPPKDNVAHFPRYLGYSGSGVVVKAGKNVKNIKVGEKVVNLRSSHSSFTTVNRPSARISHK